MYCYGLFKDIFGQTTLDEIILDFRMNKKFFKHNTKVVQRLGVLWTESLIDLRDIYG